MLGLNQGLLQRQSDVTLAVMSDDLTTRLDLMSSSWISYVLRITKENETAYSGGYLSSSNLRFHPPIDDTFKEPTSGRLKKSELKSFFLTPANVKKKRFICDYH
jgi:hypothetical protein